MVEGHSVHRVAFRFRQRLVGQKFSARSPNGRFADGAKAIHRQPFQRIEAVGKNLFAFFGSSSDPVVVHVHFGMAGNWAIYENDDKPPEPTSTNRLRLECPGLIADLSAMTVQHGTMDLYTSKREKLGEDPLRDDADPNSLWERVAKSKKSIGALIMDQSYFTGPGNIYRAEILFKAGVHPDMPGKDLTRTEFDSIWKHTVSLLRRGFETGSILTVDPAEAKALGKPKMRRYIYNASKCPRCQSSIKTWQIASRKCYACPKCQPITRSKVAAAAVVTPEKGDCIPFNSHCAPESIAERLEESGPSRLTIKEIRGELDRLEVPIPSKAGKAILVDLLEKALRRKPKFISSEQAAIEKASAGESLAVEHIAELAPAQVRKLRSKATTNVGDDANLDELKVAELKAELDNRNIAYTSNARKSSLLSLLRANIIEEEDRIPNTPTKKQRVK